MKKIGLLLLLSLAVLMGYIVAHEENFIVPKKTASKRSQTKLLQDLAAELAILIPNLANTSEQNAILTKKAVAHIEQLYNQDKNNRFVKISRAELESCLSKIQAFNTHLKNEQQEAEKIITLLS